MHRYISNEISVQYKLNVRVVDITYITRTEWVLTKSVHT
jgi:hypothetical protein